LNKTKPKTSKSAAQTTLSIILTATVPTVPRKTIETFWANVMRDMEKNMQKKIKTDMQIVALLK
jgi:hypothetical protein